MSRYNRFPSFAVALLFCVGTLAAYAAPYIAADDVSPLVTAVDARNDQVYMQLFGPGGRTLIQPRIASLRDAIRAAATGPARLVGSRAAATPTRNPVKLPGPTVTARRSSSRNSSRASLITRATSGISASACPRTMGIDSLARMPPWSVSSTAAEQASRAVSMARTRIVIEETSGWSSLARMNARRGAPRARRAHY